MNAVTSCEHDLVTITAAGPEEATTPIRKIGVGFSVPCAVTQFIPFTCSGPADPKITDFCQCTLK